MSKINILAPDLINKIAAGEVIERPVSVVKELVENALDAGATQITIDIAEGGKKYIKVIDNGSGMDKADLLLCIQQHATSKIKDQEDLFRISTLGFRGEALPSIASVSQFSIVTNTGHTGLKLSLDNGQPQISTAAAQIGTTVIAENIFYNIPARLKFLKNDHTEFNHIQNYVSKLMLSRPDVAYTLIHNQEIVLQTQGITNNPDLALRNAIASVFGTNIAKNIYKIDMEFEDISLSGYIASPTVTSSSRSSQVVFVNNRNIQSATITKAIDAAVSDSISKGRYPYIALFIDIDYRLVDVNVHPAKLEVRFVDSGKIFEAVRVVIRKALSPQKTLLATENTPVIAHHSFSTPESFDFSASPVSAKEVREVVNQTITPMPSLYPLPTTGVRILGQANRLFIIVLDGDDLLLIDQHAAHERVLYALLTTEYGKRTNSQGLLVPVHLELPTNIRANIHVSENILRDLGYTWEQFSQTSIRLTSMPTLFTKEAPEKLFLDTLAELVDGGTSSPEKLKEKAIATMACKAAVKDGDILTQQEMERLVRDLYATPHYETCPHGRPTITALTKPEMMKRFLR